MTHLLVVVVLIGVADSFNPSTVAPGLYFAAGREGHRSLIAFIAGVFVTNLVAGVLLSAGPGQALLALVPRPGDEALHLIELGAGGLTLALAAGLWLSRARLARHVASNTERIDRSSLLVGAGIMVVELPTALPYFAVIATIVGSGRSVPTQIALLAIFNVAFTAPLVAILVLRTVAGERGRRRLELLRASLDRRLSIGIPALVLAVSVALLVAGSYGVVTD